jgi:uncharacterized Zn-finger protein
MPSELKAHVRYHKRREGHVCNEPGCKLGFETEHTLRRHMRTHNIEMPYRCEICDKEFTAQVTLNKHMKEHVIEASLTADRSVNSP